MNLDLEAAKRAQKIIAETKNKSNEAENLITKALGILQENGVYACMLYLYSLSNDAKSISESIRRNFLKAIELLEEKPVSQNKEEVLKFFTNSICSDPDTLFLTKQLWEQILIYARYGAKTKE